MTVEFSRILAVAGYLGIVPGSIAVAYVGHVAGVYPYGAIPFVFAGLFVISIVVLFAVVSKLRTREGDRAPRRR
jgi:TRAP-type C4-dicarboxylate transport system permease small subunit